MTTLFLLAQNTTLQELSPAGTALLVGCVGFVLTLCGFCFYRLMREPTPAEHHHTPLDIDTRDWDDRAPPA